MFTYEEWKSKIENALENVEIGILATGCAEGVHSRAMCMVMTG